MENGGIQQQLSQGSTLQKYRSTVVGNQSAIKFLLYEFSSTLLCPLPGTFGIRMRQLLMPFLFGYFGPKVIIRHNVTFRRPYQIRLGKGVFIESGVLLDVKSNTGLIDIHDDVHIGKNTILSCPGGTITIGKGTCIGEKCRLGSLEGLNIGKHSILNDSVCIIGAGHAHSSPDLPIIKQPLTCKGPTIINDYVEIEKEVTVLDGIQIGTRAKIVAKSFINKNIASNDTASGALGSAC